MQSEPANEMSGAAGKYIQMIRRLRIGVGRRAQKELRAPVWISGAGSCLCSSGEHGAAPHRITQLRKRLHTGMRVRGETGGRRGGNREKELQSSADDWRTLPVL